MRLYILALLCLLTFSLAHSANGQSDDATVRAGFDVFTGLIMTDYSPTNNVLEANGYNAIKAANFRYGVGAALCGPLTSRFPVRLGIQAMMQASENLIGDSRTAISALNTQLALEFDLINKGPIIAGPLIGAGVVTSTINASKGNQVGSFNGYVSGNARAIALNHLTFPVTFGARVWLRLRNSKTQLYKRQGFALSGGYLLPLDGQNWYWANNVSLPRGPNQNTGSWFVQIGFGVR